ncbi:NAD(P)/FAD-dependent oxidoreductase [Roseofilum casamattae]|uniref:NAD(P)/FAD-dependent oxidoreductase n=1 Tax=Roseofilum casamattae BLCC-M143 TaxID=3022442 RepID=A0ABT7C2J5_9CYAN|nr:NAD(P)/FAD-dependent oxidoreductase [Roseofilum casamattae]MDJ1185685.1 NAD(P)/FAD-dependent oxidoreductase [Roseofilum casamattae BLCC-M143]
MNATIVILGGGPAGLSCALWLKHLGFSPIIVEKQTRLGGLQRLSFFYNSWYLGLMGKTGIEIADQLEQHITLEDIPTICGDRLQTIIQHGDRFQIFTDTQEIIAHSLVIATGQRVKGYDAIADVEGSRQLLSSENVCFDPGKTPLLSSQIDGGVVAVIGGGDNGMGTVRYLENAAQHIHLLVRSELRGFAVNKQKMLEMETEKQLKIHQPVTLRKFEKRGDRIQIVFQDENSRDAELLCDYLCFRLGFTPNVEDIVRQLEAGGIGSLKLLPSGYIATDGFGRTSIENIYVAGDVANPRDPCVATAVAQGTMAARSFEEDLQHRS